MIRWLREHAHWVLVAIAAIVLVVHSLQYNFVTDDAYISFVFSRNFAEHGELTFNLGQPVEGYTNFSWTLLLGLLMVVGVPPEFASRVLGTACAIGTLIVVTRIMLHALGRRSPWAGVPALLLASSSGFACWSSGGLETQLFTLLVIAALEAVVAATTTPRAIRRAGWLLALAAMTRPEGPMIAAVLGAIRLVQLVLDWRATKRFPLRDELYAAAWFLGLWVPWFAWRYFYYGHLFPNTYYVKAAGDWLRPEMATEMVRHGAYYIWIWLVQTQLVHVLLVVAVGIAAVRPRTPRFVTAVACALIALFYVPYTISVGGDFMGLHRFIMPLFVIAAILVVLGAERIGSLIPDERVSFPAAMGSGLALAVLAVFTVRYGYVAARAGAVPELVLASFVFVLYLGVRLGAGDRRLAYALAAGTLLVGAFALTQVALTRRSLDPKNLLADRGVIDTPAFLIVYTEDRATIGKAMAPCFRDDDFSIVGGAGAQPYYARMRGIDVFGLVSERIAHEEKRTRPRAGHTKWGSDALLASYDPTFVFSCYAIHRTAAQPQLPCAGFWKNLGYEEVTMHIPDLRERGEYYTFLAKKARNFQCPGRVH
ncbi:MAG TPA: hypothetical protein VFQ53_17285 [Kofleriaceae bacterium]|nr:hypothetical protein [Kofleriaceae bacterium]